MRFVYFGAAGVIGWALALFCLPAYAAGAVSDTVIYSFCSRPHCSDGTEPSGTLIEDAKGNLFGTAIAGGSSRCGLGSYSCGVVYKLEPGGREIVLHAFTGGNHIGGADGVQPFGYLAKGRKGRLYGSTVEGGNSEYNKTGNGVVFEIDHHHERILHAFCAQADCPDGALPWSGITIDGSDKKYGTTVSGGHISQDCPQGCGVIFEMTASGRETVLHAFGGGNDGSGPVAPPVLDAAGNLYGATSGGGSKSCSCGTVFQVVAGGAKSALYSFTGGNDGAYPSYGKLVRDASGDLYGTTSRGGGTGCGGNGCGTVFKVTRGGKEVLLHAFCAKAGCSDGAIPQFGLIPDAAGNLYGTTSQGGTSNHKCSSGCGVVFEITGKGKEIVLYSFSGAPDGATPYGNLLLDDAGNLYGTTASGGASGRGTLFRINLAPEQARS